MAVGTARHASREIVKACALVSEPPFWWFWVHYGPHVHIQKNGKAEKLHSSIPILKTLANSKVHFPTAIDVFKNMSLGFGVVFKRLFSII